MKAAISTPNGNDRFSILFQALLEQNLNIWEFQQKNNRVAQAVFSLSMRFSLGDPSEIRTPDTLIKSLQKMVFPVLCCAFLY